MDRLRRFYPKQTARSELNRALAAVNIVDHPTDGDIGGREQVSFPSEFPAGSPENDPHGADSAETSILRTAQNVGHGHVFARPDGIKMRCGGPKRCTACANDKSRKNAEIGQELTQLTTERETGKTRQDISQHGLWNKSYSDDNSFEDADLKLGGSDADSLSQPVYDPYTDGIGALNSRYEDADKNTRNIVLHSAKDNEDKSTREEHESDREGDLHQLWICVDLDGTILSPPEEYQSESGNHLFGEVLPGKEGGPGPGEALQKLIDGGARVSIYTARQYFDEESELSKVLGMTPNQLLEFQLEETLILNCIPYTDIYIGNKPPAHHFIDDRTIPPFDGDWNMVLDMLSENLNKEANDPIKDTCDYHGIKVDIEWPTGSIRSYEGQDSYVTHMKADYGYTRGVIGNDGEELDIYIVDRNSDSEIAYIIEQLTEDGEYDEDKIVLGAHSEGEAADCYLQHMPGYMLGDIREVSIEKLCNAIYGNGPEDRRGEEDLIPLEEKGLKQAWIIKIAAYSDIAMQAINEANINDMTKFLLPYIDINKDYAGMVDDLVRAMLNNPQLNEQLEAKYSPADEPRRPVEKGLDEPASSFWGPAGYGEAPSPTETQEVQVGPYETQPTVRAYVATKIAQGIWPEDDIFENEFTDGVETRENREINRDPKTEDAKYRNAQRIEYDDMCPHCGGVIHEKSLYFDGVNWFHKGSCIDKGPIVLPKPKQEFNVLPKIKRLIAKHNSLSKFCDQHDIKGVDVGLGFSDKEQKWYGWSHRAIYGFGVGDEVEEGDAIEKLPAGFKAKTLNDAKTMAMAFSEGVS